MQVPNQNEGPIAEQQQMQQVEEVKEIDELDDAGIDALMADAHDELDEQDDEMARVYAADRFTCPRTGSRSLFPLAKRVG